MSKERARRREAREREQALLTAARASEAERRERRTARSRAIASWLPERRRRPTGILAERDRRQRGATVALLVLVNVLVALLTDGWAWPALSLVVTLLAAPVLHTLLFRRS